MKKYNVASIVLNNFVNDSRVQKEAMSLTKFGHMVTVVALHEDDLLESEKTYGFSVHRMRLSSKKWSKNKFIQLVKYFEFIFRFCIMYRKFDVFHCHDLGTLPIGFLLKVISRGRAKIIYDTHEYAINDVPNESVSKQKLKFFVEHFFIKFADEVITVSDSIAVEYQKNHQIRKPWLVLNCPKKHHELKAYDIFREKFGIAQDKTIFLYQGSLGFGRGIEVLLNAFSIATNDLQVIVFMGYGAFESPIKQYAENSNNIFFHPAVPPESLLQYTASADVGVSFIEDSCLSYRYCLPNKMFEYFMAGLPIIVSNLPEMTNIVETYSAGIVARTNDVDGFFEAINRLAQLDINVLKSNAKKVTNIYNWENQELVLKDIYESI
jgi:glycosyltransferase involved in cell wall biosynthesis